MAEYIKKSAAICVAEKYGCDNGSSLGIHSGLADCIASEIEALPAADVAPVRHGRWVLIEETPDRDIYKCQWCGRLVTKRFSYCHCCGAIMDGGDPT